MNFRIFAMILRKITLYIKYSSLDQSTFPKYLRDSCWIIPKILKASQINFQTEIFYKCCKNFLSTEADFNFQENDFLWQ